MEKLIVEKEFESDLAPERFTERLEEPHVEGPGTQTFPVSDLDSI